MSLKDLLQKTLEYNELAQEVGEQLKELEEVLRTHSLCIEYRHSKSFMTDIKGGHFGGYGKITIDNKSAWGFYDISDEKKYAIANSKRIIKIQFHKQINEILAGIELQLNLELNLAKSKI